MLTVIAVNTKSDSSDSEQNEQHAALENQGGVKRQGSPGGNSHMKLTGMLVGKLVLNP